MNQQLNGVVLASSVASIGLSIYLFAKKEHHTAIFVGLWAPTFLALGSFLQATTAANKV